MKHIQQRYLIEYIEEYFTEKNFNQFDKETFFNTLKEFQADSLVNYDRNFRDVINKVFCDIAFQLEDKVK